MNDIERSPRPEPLWLQLRNHPSLFCLHPTPKQLATMLECIASEVERRDIGETAEWLRAEAARATARDAASTMTDKLSPTAQAVRIPLGQIINRLHQYSRVSISYTDRLPITIETNEGGLQGFVDELVAAALRAAADQIGMKQPLGETDADAGVFAAHNAIKHWLLAIAAELEGLS